MTIKQAADLAGVGVETVRFYEREEMIPEPPRTESGYRQYPQDTVSRIRFIKKAQSLGFSLPEIKELLSLRMARNTKPEQIRRRAVKKLAEVEAKIQALQRIKTTLKEITEECCGKGPLSDCPILKALEKEA